MAAREPYFEGSAFVCPLCEVYAGQDWSAVQGVVFGMHQQVNDLAIAQCAHCREVSVWMGGALVYPAGLRMGVAAFEETPDEVRRLYEEARTVSVTSPRSAAALLRLALQVLIDDLVTGDRDLNNKIGQLVATGGLSPEVIQAMDVVRVVGNNAVHAGQIDVDEDVSLVPSLFGLVNLIVEQVIVRKSVVARLFESLPGGARDAVDRRNARAAALDDQGA